MEKTESLVVDARNFKPRDGVLEQGMAFVREGLQTLPFQGRTKVLIVDQGKSFFISIVTTTKNKILSTEATYFKTVTAGWPRNWQIDAVSRIFRSLLQQIRSPNENRQVTSRNLPADVSLKEDKDI
jgi:hypothetical protein